jgi:hypothetical protein
VLLSCVQIAVYSSLIRPAALGRFSERIGTQHMIDPITSTAPELNSRAAAVVVALKLPERSLTPMISGATPRSAFDEPERNRNVALEILLGAGE